jgi:hypothetical protein
MLLLLLYIIIIIIIIIAGILRYLSDVVFHMQYSCYLTAWRCPSNFIFLILLLDVYNTSNFYLNIQLESTRENKFRCNVP